jgi:heat shock protein HslJ
MLRMLVLVFAIALAGCASTPDPVAGDWRLTHIEGGPSEFGPRAPTLSFNADGTAGGYAGCNQFFATVTRNDPAITFTQIGATKMFCEATMQVEAAYLGALGRVRNAREQQGQLLMFDEGGTEVLRFAR